MRKSVLLALVAIQVAIAAWWFANLRDEGGVDGILYHHMSEAIVRFGYAPWIVNPLSYIGIYPGSDSSGVPFLVASVASLSGVPLNASILVYNLVLTVLLGLGLFVLVHTTLHKVDAALLASVFGPLAYGFFSSMLWTLDERSFNVALTPVFLLLVVSWARGERLGASPASVAVLATISFVMYASHLSLLLLLPLPVIVPLVRLVVLRQNSFRMKTRGSPSFVLATIGLPVLIILVMSWTGLLSSLGLQISLEHSALMSGGSAIAYLVNTAVFLSTRAGPVIIVLAVLGLLYLGTRRVLSEGAVVIGAILLGGLIGLPIIVYSKDVVTPMLILPAALAIPVVMRRFHRDKAVALALASVVVFSGSLAFDQWNLARTTAYSNALYWTSPGVTTEPVSANAWMAAEAGSSVCLFGNNWLATRYSSTSPYEFICGDSPVENLVWLRTGLGGTEAIHFQFVGVNGVSPSDWFESPELDQVATDFASIPSLGYASGIALLARYHVTFIVVALENPTGVPLYQYEGVRVSRFFSELWSSSFPLYRTQMYAVFSV